MDAPDAGRLTFDLHPSAGPVVRKGGEPARLRREQAALRAAAGPGVVELVGAEGPPDAPTELMLAAITGDPLTAADLAPEEVAPVMAEVAATVARLHQAGVVHGDLAPEHVVLAPQGPVLCGFGHAACASSLDDLDGAWPAATAADVLALGQLLHGVMVALDGGDSVLRQALRRVVERATRSEPLERPSATDVATSLRELAPAPAAGTGWDPLERLRPLASGDERSGAGRRARRRLGMAALAVGAAALGATAVPALAGGPATRQHPPPSTTTTMATSTTTTEASPVVERVWPAECRPPCSAPRLRHAGSSFTAGEPGDVALLLDAGCDGVLDPVVVRPATGAVFVFAMWPDPGQELEVAPAARFPTAVTAVEAADVDGDGCAELVGTSTAGPLPMRVPAPAR